MEKYFVLNVMNCNEIERTRMKWIIGAAIRQDLTQLMLQTAV